MTCPPPAPRLSGGLYRAAFDEHPQPMWIYDADDLSVIAANDAAIRQYGHAPDALGELRVHELHPAADAERAVAYYLDGVLVQGRKRAWVHVRRDGSTLEVETMLARLGGDFNRRLLIAEEVTERNRAERALREAKQRYTALVGDSYEAICLARQMALESDLRRALDRGELLLHYQPIFDARSRETVGVEALLRWQHPSRGLLPPDEFIAIAERTGQIVPVGAWVLRQACLDLQRLREAHGADLRVSVNLSARQLQEPELVDTMRAIMSETGTDPRLLELEITESVAMQNAEATLATLRALKEMGVSLAVDDFGTGYSSLLYLTRFPIDTVKIDRQFVGNVTSDPGAAAVVGAVVALAHSLQLKTVAEGVETTEQRDFLLSHMCAELQGFLLARPVPLDFLLEGIRRQASGMSRPGDKSQTPEA